MPSSISCKANQKFATLKADSGSFASFNYPLPYDEEVECSWRIMVDSDYRIVLTFNSFNLSSSSRCSADYVSVYDGMHETSERIGKFCGSTKPSTITSNHSEMFVKFVANGKAQYPGFKASYTRKSKRFQICWV